MRSCDRHEVPSVVLVPLGLPWLAYLGLPQPINNQVVNPHGCPRTLPEKRGKTNEKHSPGDSYHTRGPHTIDSSKVYTKIIDKLKHELVHYGNQNQESVSVSFLAGIGFGAVIDFLVFIEDRQECNQYVPSSPARKFKGVAGKLQSVQLKIFQL